MSNRGMSRTIPYAIVDVFAEHPLEGNALAIFTNARGLSTEQMQCIARETNLSETAFILPRPPEVERDHGVHVRIFTVHEELRFAGHPTLGTAAWIYANHPHLRGSETIQIDLAAGRIPVTFGSPEAAQSEIFGTMRQLDPVFGQVHDVQETARALNLAVHDLDLIAPIQTVSTGLPFCIVPLRSMDVASRLQILQQGAATFLAHSDAKFFYCITRAHHGSSAHWHARMQFYGGEDPATGSAAGCAVAWLVRHGVVTSGVPHIIEQGVEIRRPSRIHVQATRTPEGAVSGVFVGGRTIPVASGHLFLP